MVTEEEKREIIDRAKEEILLSIPEVIGHQMASFAALAEQNRKFWTKYPEFAKHKDAARSVIEMTEGKNPLLDHKDILKKAVPEIRKRIDTLKKLDLDTVKANPPRQFEQIEAPTDNPHGEF